MEYLHFGFFVWYYVCGIIHAIVCYGLVTSIVVYIPLYD